MKIKIDVEKTQVLLCRAGVWSSLLFNPLPPEAARLLVREYGFRPEEVRAVEAVTLTYEYELDDAMAAEAAEEMGAYGDGGEAFWTEVDGGSDTLPTRRGCCPALRAEMAEKVVERLLPFGRHSPHKD